LWELNFVTLTFARKSTMMWRNELEAWFLLLQK
jgi:hypothetical protein